MRIARPGRLEMDMARQQMTKVDEQRMAEALSLARRGEGRTRPNPPVGAVLVRGGRVVGLGYHAKAGGPHAEIVALDQAGAASRGATLYVTLEPCCTHGRTGPCTEAIAAAGVRRVVVSVRDPNPKHNGRGLRRLTRAGIRVDEGVCAGEGRRLIAPFSKWITTGRPYVTLKLGSTIDGRIAGADGRSKWITGEESRQWVKGFRQTVDAILVGRQTACLDNPGLLPGGVAAPTLYRVVADTSGRLPATSQVLTDAYARHTILATTAACPAARRVRCAAGGAAVWVLPQAGGHVSLSALMSRLGRMGLLHVLCEGGGELAAGLIRSNQVDQYLFFLAPRLLGGGGSVPSVGGWGWTLSGAPRLRYTEVRRMGEDILVRAEPCSRD